MLGVQAELHHAMERGRQLIIGSACLSEVLSYGKTSYDKVGLGYEEKRNEKSTTQLTFLKQQWDLKNCKVSRLNMLSDCQTDLPPARQFHLQTLHSSFDYLKKSSPDHMIS